MKANALVTSKHSLLLSPIPASVDPRESASLVNRVAELQCALQEFCKPLMNDSAAHNLKTIEFDFEY